MLQKVSILAISSSVLHNYYFDDSNEIIYRSIYNYKFSDILIKIVFFPWNLEIIFSLVTKEIEWLFY